MKSCNLCCSGNMENRWIHQWSAVFLATFGFVGLYGCVSLHDFPFVNSWWLIPVIFLSFMCLKTVSRIVSFTFPGNRVRLVGLQLPGSYLLSLKTRAFIDTYFLESSGMSPTSIKLPNVVRNDFTMVRPALSALRLAPQQVAWNVRSNSLKILLIWSSLTQSKSFVLCIFPQVSGTWNSRRQVLAIEEQGEQGALTFLYYFDTSAAGWHFL